MSACPVYVFLPLLLNSYALRCWWFFDRLQGDSRNILLILISKEAYISPLSLALVLGPLQPLCELTGARSVTVRYDNASQTVNKFPGLTSCISNCAKAGKCVLAILKVIALHHWSFSEICLFSADQEGALCCGANSLKWPVDVVNPIQIDQCNSHSHLNVFAAAEQERLLWINQWNCHKIKATLALATVLVTKLLCPHTLVPSLFVCR